jgi:membrane associated rhomboid family serine protease
MSRYYRTTYSSVGYPRWTRAVKIIIIACAITFLVQNIMDRDARIVNPSGFTNTFGLTPWAVVHGSVWQLVTYIFLHGSILHILFNMLGLWMFGSELEQVWGTRQFTKFFFVCGIGAGITIVAAAYFFDGTNLLIPTIGASGAVYGILLAFGMLFPDRIIYWVIFPIPAKYFVMILGGLAFFSSISTSNSGVAHVAHLGGMLCGYIYMRVRGMSRRRHPRRRISAGVKDWYGQWQRRRLRRKFDVYYNRRHGNGGNTDDEKWRRWKN